MATLKVSRCPCICGSEVLPRDARWRYALGLAVAHLRRCFSFIVPVDAATSDNGISDGLAGNDTAWFIPSPNSLGIFTKNSSDQELVVRNGGGSENQGQRWQWLDMAEAWWVRWWSFEGEESAVVSFGKERSLR